MRSVTKVLALPAVRKRFDDLAYEVGGGTPEAFAAEVANEVTRLKRLNEMLKIENSVKIWRCSMQQRLKSRWPFICRKPKLAAKFLARAPNHPMVATCGV